MSDLSETRALRTAMGAFATAALVAGVAAAAGPWDLPLPGSVVLSLGMLAFLLVPLLMRVPCGISRPAGHGLRFFTGRSTTQTLDLVARVLGSAAWGAVNLSNPEAMSNDTMLGLSGFLVGTACALLALWGLADRMLWAERDAPSITLEETTLTLRGSSGTRVLSYADLRGVEIERNENRTWVVVSTDTDRHSVPVQGPRAFPEEIRGAILDAKAAAQGFRDEGVVNASQRALARPRGMNAREWLGRVDALAQMAGTSTAYRSAALDDDDLFAVLADAHAEADTRAAAARVLSRSTSDAVRARVAAEVSGIGDEAVRVRVDGVMRQDGEEAAANLDALDAEEIRRAVRG